MKTDRSHHIWANYYAQIGIRDQAKDLHGRSLNFRPWPLSARNKNSTDPPDLNLSIYSHTFLSLHLGKAVPGAKLRLTHQRYGTPGVAKRSPKRDAALKGVKHHPGAVSDLPVEVLTPCRESISASPKQLKRASFLLGDLHFTLSSQRKRSHTHDFDSWG